MSVKIYTKTGDAGETNLIGERRSKADPIFGVLDKLEQLSGDLGFFVAERDDHKEFIMQVQEFLIDVGAAVATTKQGKKAKARREKLEAEATQFTEDCETDIDAMTDRLPPLKNFVLPIGSAALLSANRARLSCRRAERAVVKIDLDLPQVRAFLNRFSDWLFTVSRTCVGHVTAYQENKGHFQV